MYTYIYIYRLNPGNLLLRLLERDAERKRGQVQGDAPLRYSLTQSPYAAL